MDRDTLGHVVSADRPVAKAVRQLGQLGWALEVAHQLVHRLTRFRKAKARERSPSPDVVLVCERDPSRGLGEDLVEEVR